MKKVERDVRVPVLQAMTVARKRILSFLASSGSPCVSRDEMISKLSVELPKGVGYLVWVKVLPEALEQLVRRGDVVSEGEGESECFRLASGKGSA